MYVCACAYTRAHTSHICSYFKNSLVHPYLPFQSTGFIPAFFCSVSASSRFGRENSVQSSLADFLIWWILLYMWSLLLPQDPTWWRCPPHPARALAPSAFCPAAWMPCSPLQFSRPPQACPCVDGVGSPPSDSDTIRLPSVWTQLCSAPPRAYRTRLLRREGFSGILSFTLRFLAVELSLKKKCSLSPFSSRSCILILGSLQKFISGNIHQLQVFFLSSYKYIIVWVQTSFISLFLMSWFFCYVFYFFPLSFGRVP